MKIVLVVFSLLLIACARTKPPTVAIRGVTVVDVMDGSLRPQYTVLVRGNRIMAVGPADKIDIPGGADLIDERGFLIPGLWDMHVHSVANVAWDMRVASVSNAD